MRRTVFVFRLLFIALIANEPTQQTVAQEKFINHNNGGDFKVTADEKTGITIGEKAPTVKLMDQNGKEGSVDELLHEGSAAVSSTNGFRRKFRWEKGKAIKQHLN